MDLLLQVGNIGQSPGELANTTDEALIVSNWHTLVTKGRF